MQIEMLVVDMSYSGNQIAMLVVDMSYMGNQIAMLVTGMSDMGHQIVRRAIWSERNPGASDGGSNTDHII